jgi:uncharacterized membrane protein
MLFATLLISGHNWVLPVACVLGASLLLLLWAYGRAPAGAGVRLVCTLLKLIGIAALAACLLEPIWTGQRARPGANFFAVVADNSQGMQIKDRGESRNRGEVLRELLRPDQSPWQAKLEENFQVRRYVFDSRLQATKDFTELTFDGRMSSLGTSLRMIGERFKEQPLAGVLLLTDGNATDMPDGVVEFAGLPPVYPVVMGKDDPIKDIAVQKVTVTQTSFEDAPVSIQADVVAGGYAGERIVAQLVEAGHASVFSRTNKTPATGGKVVEEQTQRAPRDGDVLSFRFQLRPEKPGLSFYRLRVAARQEQGQFEKPESSAEATLANNARMLAVDRGKGPYQILYVAGRPNWEYKFLNRAVTEDDQIQLVGLIRIAKREPKFDFRGRFGETSNPLFRGFGNQSKEEIERYDQPVLVRLYPNKELELREETKLRGGFPKIPEDLYAYHAVILDKLEAEFFTHDQMTLLQKFVSERGGGLLMLGGAESFREGKYERTPIGDMLPVYLDRVPEGKAPEQVRLNLSREGWLQPWARLRATETEEKTRIEDMPPFLVLNQVRDIKPGASPIAYVTDPAGKNYPAVVVQRFGHGRTAAVTIGDVWHWGFRDQEVHRDMEKAWRQLMRWLVADVPQRVQFEAEQKRGDPNQAVNLQVRVRDEKFQPLDNAAVTITIRTVGPPTPTTSEKSTAPAAPAMIQLIAEPALNESGLYQAAFVPRETGGYYAETTVTNAVGAEVGRAEAGWTSDPAAEEFRSLKPNRALLEAIAKKTGGEVISASHLEAFAENLPNRHAPVTESWSFPLWHRASVFLFALACFVVEWGLRRWKGMA